MSNEPATLIARLETAPRGDKELTADVYEALGYLTIRAPKWSGGISWRCRRPGDQRWCAMRDLTERIDDAASIVPEGYCWSVHRGYGGKCWAIVTTDMQAGMPRGEWWSPGGDPTDNRPALRSAAHALCIAAAKAHLLPSAFASVV